MAVPYPPNGQVNYSQNREHRNGLASRYILEHLDEKPEWNAVEQHLVALLGKDHASDALLIAELDLEWHGAIQYDQTWFRRPGLPSDIAFAPLNEVADAIMRLGWPRSDGRRSRTVHDCFLELEGRYRHCDVYWAMHEVLKNKRLRCVRAWWMLQDDMEKVLADPTLSVAQRDALERELEADLRDSYAESLSHRVAREYALDRRYADIFDTHRALIIEAKISTDDLVVLGAVTQAMHYRMLANRDAHRIDSIAVLLPAAPSELARSTLRQNDIDVGFIWRSGDGFTEDLA